MKHHFGDELDRTYGHWTITPNRERWAHHYPSLDDAPVDVAALTLTRTDEKWERALSFKGLIELTLHEPSQDQLAAIPNFCGLKALRITHARPKSLAMLSSQIELRELVLEYISGVADVTVLGELPKLAALHVENMRNVSDFSPLGRSKSLRYLSLDGTPDWKQPIDSLEFVGSMRAIQFFRLANVRVPKIENPFRGLAKSETIKWLRISMDNLPLAEFARLEATMPNVDGAKRPAFSKYGGFDRELSPRDIRSRMPLDELAKYQDLYVAADGRRFQRVPHQALLLGKGERHISGAEPMIDERCEAHRKKYDALVAAMRAVQGG